jgi:hypothetical protein
VWLTREVRECGPQATAEQDLVAVEMRSNPDVKALVAEHGPALGKLFNHAAGTVPTRNSIHTDTLTLRELLALLQQVGS